MKQHITPYCLLVLIGLILAVSTSTFADEEEEDVLFEIIVLIEGQGSVTVDPEGDPPGFFKEGDIVTLTAYPEPGWVFVEWVPSGVESPRPGPSGSSVPLSQNLGSTENPLVIEIVDETIVIAVFEQVPTGTIIIEKQTIPDGASGTFTFSDAANDTLGTLKDGEQFVLSDIPAGTFTVLEAALAGWVLTDMTFSDSDSSGDLDTGVATIELEAGETVTVVFTNTQQHTLTTSTVGDGTVAAVPLEPAYLHGTSVQLSATPDVGWVFDGWSGDLTTTDNPSSITMDSDKHVTTRFSRKMLRLTLSSSAGGRVVAPGEGDFMYPYGTWVYLEARANEPKKPTDPVYTFKHWRGSYAGSQAKTSYRILNDTHSRAIFECQSDVLHVDDDGLYDPAPYDANTSDPNENGSEEHPFDEIMEAIEVAREGSTVLVRAGTYWENVNFMQKGITVTGMNPKAPTDGQILPIIDGKRDGAVVTFNSNRHPHTILSHFVITRGLGFYAGGLNIIKSRPTIENCLVVGNVARAPNNCAGGIRCEDSQPVLINCSVIDNLAVSREGSAGLLGLNSPLIIQDSIVYGNLPLDLITDLPVETTVTFSNIGGGFPGPGNLDMDPLFVMPGLWVDEEGPIAIWNSHPGMSAGTLSNILWTHGDYHLQAKSPCVDAGDPNSPVRSEPQPNGDRVNQGAYGGTQEATTTVIP